MQKMKVFFNPIILFISFAIKAREKNVIQYAKITHFLLNVSTK